MPSVKLIISLTAILSLTKFSQINALRCFACALTSTSGDQKCITDPVSVEGQSIVTCSKKYCTILRQELTDPPGKIVSFLRGCEETPILLNDVVKDDTFTTYYQSCSSDLCNNGDGIGSGTNLISADGYKTENLLVPGLPNAANKANYVFMLTFIMLCVLKIIEIL